MKIVLIVVAVWIVGTLMVLGAAALTGRVPRAYPVLAPDAPVEIGGDTRPVSDWAAAYLPQMLLRPETPSPPLLWVFFEAVDPHDGSLVLIYSYVWQDEIHPDPVYHRLYRLFRGAYYGYPVRDIEYLQVRIDRAGGEVVEAMFETSPGLDYFPAVSKHIVSRVTRGPDGQFILRLSERGGRLISEQGGAAVCVEGRRLKAAVATWNHLTRLAGCEEAAPDLTAGAPLKPLSGEDYQNFKFARKSQGDYATPQNPSVLLLLGGVFVLLMSPILLGNMMIKKARRV